MKYLLFLTLSLNLYALPDFRITNMQTNNNCTSAFVTFANKGSGISHSYYDRDIHRYPFFLIRGEKTARLLYLDEVDPNRRMTSSNGYSSVDLTPYLHMEKGEQISAMVNYGFNIPESKYGAPSYGNLKINCPNLPNVADDSLQVRSWYVIQNSNCNVRVNLKNPGPEQLSLSAWNSQSSNNLVYHYLGFNNLVQEDLYMNSFDPQKKLKLGGGLAGHTYASNNFKDDFRPGQSKLVRIGGSWLGGAHSPRKLYDLSKVLHCGSDLAATYKVFPTKPKIGDRVTMRFKVRNLGTDTTQATSIEIKFGGEANGSIYALQSLFPGKYRYINRSITINRAGNYRVRVKIDRTNKNIEYNKTNNTFEFIVTVSN